MAGPGAGTPEHRTMRGLPEEAGGVGGGGEVLSISGTGRTGARGFQDGRGVAGSSSGR